MVEVIEVVQNDELYDIDFTIKDYLGVVKNITGATIQLQVAAIGGTSLILDGTCDLVVPANGTCKYTVQNGELVTVGIFHAQLQITFSTNEIKTTEDFDIRVVKDLP
jgi:hypothetical protein